MKKLALALLLTASFNSSAQFIVEHYEAPLNGWTYNHLVNEINKEDPYLTEVRDDLVFQSYSVGFFKATTYFRITDMNVTELDFYAYADDGIYLRINDEDFGFKKTTSWNHEGTWQVENGWNKLEYYYYNNYSAGYNRTIFANNITFNTYHTQIEFSEIENTDGDFKFAASTVPIPASALLLGLPLLAMRRKRKI